MASENAAAHPRKKRVYRRAEQRRREIIDAAQKAFTHSTFAGARTRDIAEAAGVNQATLFKFFPSKEKLFEEAVMKPLIDAMENMHGRVVVYESARSPEEMGRIAEESTLRHLEDMERIFPLLTTALFSDVEQGRALFREHLEPLVRERGEVLRPLVKEGIDPEFVGLVNFGMMFAVTLQRWLGERGGKLEEITTQFNRISTSGFARTKDTGNEKQ